MCLFYYLRCLLEGGGSTDSFFVREDLPVNSSLGKLRIIGTKTSLRNDIFISLIFLTETWWGRLYGRGFLLHASSTLNNNKKNVVVNDLAGFPAKYLHFICQVLQLIFSAAFTQNNALPKILQSIWKILNNFIVKTYLVN
jgi:hypothetical protein